MYLFISEPHYEVSLSLRIFYLFSSMFYINTWFFSFPIKIRMHVSLSLSLTHTHTHTHVCVICKKIQYVSLPLPSTKFWKNINSTRTKSNCCRNHMPMTWIIVWSSACEHLTNKTSLSVMRCCSTSMAKSTHIFYPTTIHTVEVMHV
jgi:hypothetical protein